MTDLSALRQSPLHERHVALGAKMADFGGWAMPIEYPGGGVVKEHTAVREGVGVFDVSHLGKAVVAGPGALDFVNSTLTNDLRRIGPGQAQYTLCCDDATGGVVDDLIVYLKSDDDVFLIPNAANTAEVVRRLREAAPEGSPTPSSTSSDRVPCTARTTWLSWWSVMLTPSGAAACSRRCTSAELAAFGTSSRWSSSLR